MIDCFLNTSYKNLRVCDMTSSIARYETLSLFPLEVIHPDKSIENAVCCFYKITVIFHFVELNKMQILEAIHQQLCQSAFSTRRDKVQQSEEKNLINTCSSNRVDANY